MKTKTEIQKNIHIIEFIKIKNILFKSYKTSKGYKYFLYISCKHK